MKDGFTSWDKAWLPLVVAGAGVLGYHGVISAEGANFITESGPTLLAMVAQAVIVFFRPNKGT
ncbi:MAG: hypothetical protein GTN49_10800 [candidate division Zixibacteria bacterium]|nr:hypothetical protein [candidate division Zixibacteria bacterium]